VDKLVWLPVKSGEYTSRSGYGVTSLTVLPTAQVRFNWQANLWKLHTMPKIKLFLWKAAAGALPVGAQLVRRHISSTWDCARCGAPETSTHMLFHCDFAAQVWNLAPLQLGHIPIGTPILEALNLLKKTIVLPPVGIHTATLFPWICWHIWKARNQLIFQNSHFSVIETVTKAVQDALAWQSAQLALPKVRVATPRPNSTTTLTHDFLCYVDAAWQQQSSLAGSGWVFQATSHSEKEITTFSAGCRRFPSPLAAEAWAIKSAMLHALQLERSDLLVLSDSKSIVDALNSNVSLNEIFGLLVEIRSIRNRFRSISFQFIPRLVNSIADAAAKLSLCISGNIGLDPGTLVFV